VPRKERRPTDELDDTRFTDPDWGWVGDRRTFVVATPPAVPRSAAERTSPKPPCSQIRPVEAVDEGGFACVILADGRAMLVELVLAVVALGEGLQIGEQSDGVVVLAGFAVAIIS
jgi:hypothetical protein